MDVLKGRVPAVTAISETMSEHEKIEALIFPENLKSSIHVTTVVNLRIRFLLKTRRANAVSAKKSGSENFFKWTG